MEDFQNKAKSHQKIDSIADMKNFVENYPQFKKMSGTVSKHVTLVSELSRLVSKRNLLAISELEQELVSGGDLKDMVKEVSEMVQNEKTSLEDAARLCMLFALRFETSSASSVRSVVALLRRRGGEREARLVQTLQRYAGQNVRKGELFAEQNNATKITGRLEKAFGLKGVENVYTQHSPLLKQITEDCLKGKLKASSFPALGACDTSLPAKTVVVFVIGGFTYQEAHAVYQLNSQLGSRVLLGGTSVLNSSAFLQQVEAAYPPQT
jgi:vacuolar protein sorting-associated protein 45